MCANTPSSDARANNLTLTLPVTFPEAALGATVQVPTLDGEAGVTEDSSRYSHRTHLPSSRQGCAQPRDKHGDLLVTVEVAVPQRVDGKARETLEAYRDATAGRRSPH